MKQWALVGLIVACNASGDLLNSYGMRQMGRVRQFRPSALGRLAAAISHNRYVLGGLVAMAVAFFALLALLSISELSFAIPATAASYVVETVLAKLVLREQVQWERWAGAGLVAGGAFLLTLP